MEREPIPEQLTLFDVPSTKRSKQRTTKQQEELYIQKFLDNAFKRMDEEGLTREERIEVAIKLQARCLLEGLTPNSKLRITAGLLQEAIE